MGALNSQLFWQNGMGILNVSTTLQPSENSNIKLFGVDNSTVYETNWDNQSFPSWNLSNIYQGEESFWLNNGTEDVQVDIFIDINESISKSFSTNYFTFNVLNDKDKSVLSNWDGIWDEFSEINWQGYQDDYWDEYGIDWASYSNSGSEESSTDEYSSLKSNSSDFFDSSSSSEMCIPRSSDSSEKNSGSGTEVWGDYWENLTDYSSDTNAYSSLKESLSGDETWWFVNVYLEQWNITYNGYANYTWYYADSGDLIENPAEINWNPAYDNEWDWGYAQTLLTNETYDHFSHVEVNFVYQISQWVSWWDQVSESIAFASTDISYFGMSVFNDTNQNGIADSLYNQNSFTGGMNYDPTQSEIKYNLLLDSFKNISWGINASDTELNIDITLEGVRINALPYENGDNTGELLQSWMMDENPPESPKSNGNIGISENLTEPIEAYLNNLTVSFSYSPDSTGSSLAVKHELADFTNTTDQTTTLPQFNDLGLTIDYSLDSHQFSNLFYLNSQENSKDITSALPTEGNIQAQTSDSTLIDMNFSLPYWGGPDHHQYINTVALSPYYALEDSYFGSQDQDTTAAGIDSELAYSAQSDVSYVYSLCFSHWGGYSLEMDPEFKSILTYSPISPSSFPLKLILLVGLPLLGLFALIMGKQEYRSFLLNRLTFLDTGVHRLSIIDVLENENRSQIIDQIIEEPGIHYSELLRRIKISPGNLTWHIEILERYKVIKSEIVGKYVMYFPYYMENPLGNIDLRLKKSKTTMEILQLIQSEP
ncbi:MAG: winged helix-turn-helix transcriptional regulator, partial [Promethearchaeota archaeon]